MRHVWRDVRKGVDNIDVYKKYLSMTLKVWKGEVKDDGLVLTMWVDVHVEVALTCNIASCDVCDRIFWNRLLFVSIWTRGMSCTNWKVSKLCLEVIPSEPNTHIRMAAMVVLMARPRVKLATCRIQAGWLVAARNMRMAFNRWCGATFWGDILYGLLSIMVICLNDWLEG